MATVGEILINFAASTAGYMAGSKLVKEDGASITSMFSGSAVAIGGAFAAVGGAVAGATGMVEWLKSSADAIGALADKSQQLNVPVEALTRLQFGAKMVGVESETLEKSLTKLQVNIGKAVTEGGSAADTFTKLGLDLKSLAQQSPDEQFKTMAQAISQIQDPAQRAAAEVAAFGKAGAELNNLLEGGAGGIDAMAQQADNLGITISGIEAQKVDAAGDALDTAKTELTAIGEHLVAKIAPAITDVITRFVAWSEQTHFVTKAADALWTGITYGAAGVATVYEYLKAGVEAFGAVGTAALYGLVEGFAQLAHGASWVLEKVFGSKIDTTGIDAAADYLKRKSQDLAADAAKSAGNAASGRTAAEVFKYFDQTEDSATKSAKAADDANAAFRKALNVPGAQTDEQLKKVTETLADLHKQVDTFGMSDGAKKLYDLTHGGANAEQTAEATTLVKQLDILKQQAEVTKDLKKLREDAATAGMTDAQKQAYKLKGEGASQSQIDEANKLAKEADAKKEAAAENKRLDDQAKKLKEDGLGPLEKEASRIAELQKLYATGRITKEQFLKADAAGQKNTEAKSPTAVVQGSQAAASLMNEINNRGKGKSVAQQIAQKHLTVAEKMLAAMTKVADKVGGSGMQQASIGV